jgi:phage tail sheath protein FI
MMAIFSLPVSYHTDDAVAYPAQLANEIAANESGRILSYGAVYHPWLIVRDTTAPLPLSLRTIPPDGGVCGAIAATTISSGAWIAPANVALTNVVDLQPVLASGVESEFDANQINLIAQEPEGFLIMGQDTLITVEADLEPLNVRRLLILIRRLVLREGTRYVFQNISPTFQRQVARQFEYWMQQLLARGAFAGLSAQDSYQVIADQTVNPPDSIDQGRFIVQLLVAPSVPMRFLTVQLTQSDGQLSLLET